MEKAKKVEFSEQELVDAVTAAMYILSDGLMFRLVSEEEDKGTPLVMETPECIAEVVAAYVFKRESFLESQTSDSQLPDGKDSSTSTA